MTLGLFGFGHIGRTIARRAKAFDMTVVVANRSAVPASQLVDGAFALGDAAFWSAADAIVVSLPLTEGTRGIVGKAEFAAMRPDAVILNVGRGPVIDEQALYDALTSGQIGGAVIDTWYHYPTGDEAASCRHRASRVAERSDDAAHVRLDQGNHPATARPDRQECQSPGGRRAA
jgi:phosphoglycerate dehydrogenase-like enzyme